RPEIERSSGGLFFGTEAPMLAGSCLCGSIAYEVDAGRGTAPARSCCAWDARTRRLRSGPKCTSGDPTPRRGSIPGVNSRNGPKAKPHHPDVAAPEPSGDRLLCMGLFSIFLVGSA